MRKFDLNKYILVPNCIMHKVHNFLLYNNKVNDI